jgi:hypothetical protein
MEDPVSAWKHDDLAHDLAMHVLSAQRMVWCDMQLGPVGSPRPDVYALDKSFAYPRATTYECKVSVADFRADVTAGKWQSYLPFSSGVYFAAPSGLLKREDVPKGCGLIVRGDEGWRTLRAPTLQSFRMTQDVCLKLLIDGRENEVRPACKRERTEYGAVAKIAKRWGEETAKVLADLDGARSRRDHWEKLADEHRKQIGDAKESIRLQVESLTSHWLDELCRLLSMPRGGFGDIAHRVGELRKLALGEKRWHRSNLESAETALEAELRRVRDLRVLMGEIEPVEVSS